MGNTSLLQSLCIQEISLEMARALLRVFSWSVEDPVQEITDCWPGLCSCALGIQLSLAFGQQVATSCLSIRILGASERSLGVGLFLKLWELMDQLRGDSRNPESFLLILMGITGLTFHSDWIICTPWVIPTGPQFTHGNVSLPRSLAFLSTTPPPHRPHR